MLDSSIDRRCGTFLLLVLSVGVQWTVEYPVPHCPEPEMVELLWVTSQEEGRMVGLAFHRAIRKPKRVPEDRSSHHVSRR